MHLTVVDDQPDELDSLAQDRRMRAVLVDMQLLMYGNAMKWESSFSSGKPTGGDCPSGEAQPLHTEWQQKYVLAAPENREQVIADATDALIRARVRTDPIPVGETAEQWEERAIGECDGMTAREAALHMRTGVSTIVRLRRKFSRDPNDGTMLPEQPSAGELAARGLSARQIAVILGWTPQRAQYHVNKARRLAA